MTTGGKPPDPQQQQDELLLGLPVRVSNWLRSHPGWRFLIITCFGAVLGAAFFGIIEGEAFYFWTNSLRPWFNYTYPDWQVSRRLLTWLTVGWIIAVLSSLSGYLIYGANRRLLGRLETVGEENAEREGSITQLRQQVGEYTNEVQRLKEALAAKDSMAIEIERLNMEARLAETLRQCDDDLFFLFSEGQLDERRIYNLSQSILQRVRELFRPYGVRASVYTPDPDDPEVLTIKWMSAVGEESRRWNRWYIGQLDATMTGKDRGIPGTVWIENRGRVTPDVGREPLFVDKHEPKRQVLPYRSLLHALIYPSYPAETSATPLGELVLDSREYTFSDRDLLLVTRIATRLGWLLKADTRGAATERR